MAAAPGNFPNAGHFYSNITKPIDISLNFIVDSTNTNGLGVRSVKSNGYVKNVFMHTSATPASGSPNPALGYAMIQLAGNFNHYIGKFNGQIIPNSSSGVTSVVAGNVYIILTIGTTTAAQFLAAGVKAGLTAAVGMSFVAIKTGALGGTGTLGAPGVPTAHVMSVVGSPDLSIANSNVSANGGAILIIQFAAPTDASTTTLVAANPSNETVVSMSIRLDGSSVTVDGL